MTRLRVANLLSGPMFLKLLELLHLSKVTNEAYNCDHSAFIEFCDLERQRNKAEIFVLRAPKYQKSGGNFLEQNKL